MVIQETMRLFPPIWALIRIAAGDDEIGGHKIAAGDKVVMLTYIAHHSPKYWEFTPDYVGPQPAKIHATVTLCPKGGLPFKIRELT
jgi:cytochrome P450